MPARRTLIMVTGGEGAGKSTVMSALLPVTDRAAKVDAEDVGQVNPFVFDRTFLELLWSNTIVVIVNFWASGYSTVITGSCLDGDTRSSFEDFRVRLPAEVDIFLIHLRASKPIRDQRRIERSKPSTAEWRDRVDTQFIDDGSLSEVTSVLRYIPIDNTNQAVEETIAAVQAAIPEIYGASA